MGRTVEGWWIGALAAAALAAGSPQASGEAPGTTSAGGALEYRIRPVAVDGLDVAGETVSALAGDVDGDGQPDLVVGRPSEGVAYIVSGSDGSLLFTLRARGWAATRFGTSTAAVGDLDGDGVPDLAVAAPGISRVFLFGSSLGYRPVQTIPLPPRCGACDPALSMVGLGDAAAARDEAGPGGPAGFLVGVPGANGGSGTVLAVVATAGGRLPLSVRRWDGRDGEGFGFSVAPATQPGGEPAALVGAPGRNRVVLLSLATGRRLAEFVPPRAGALGQAVVTLGDVDGDGVPDFAATDPDYRDGRGRIVAFSGANRSVLWSVEGATAGDRLGLSLADVGDKDRDGVADVAVGGWRVRAEPEAISLRLFILSGRDGRRIGSVEGPTGGGPGRFRVHPAGDLDGDGLPDLFVGLDGRAAGGSSVGYLALSGQPAAQGQAPGPDGLPAGVPPQPSAPAGTALAGAAQPPDGPRGPQGVLRAGPHGGSGTGPLREPAAGPQPGSGVGLAGEGVEWHATWLLVTRQGQHRALVLEASLPGPLPEEVARNPWEVRIGHLHVTVAPGNLLIAGGTARLAQPVGELQELKVQLDGSRVRLVTRRTDVLDAGEVVVELAVAGRRWSGVVPASRVAKSYLAGRPSGP